MITQPHLQTARLHVRLATAEDADALAKFYRDCEDWLGRVQTPRPASWKTPEFWRTEVERLREAFEADRSCQLFLFQLGDSQRVLGQIHLFTFVRGAFQACTCGYAVREDAQGQGFMTEALRAAIAFAFGPLNMHRIMANVHPENVRSLRLLKQLGFEQEGYARKYLLQNGVWRDHILTALTNDAWASNGPTEGTR